jgi:hypothetical protein
LILKNNFVDILNRTIYAALIEIENDKIKKIEKISENCEGVSGTHIWMLGIKVFWIGVCGLST